MNTQIAGAQQLSVSLLISEIAYHAVLHVERVIKALKTR